MGTYAGYFGELNIPEERKPELAQRMLKLFTQGGMMSVDSVNMLGYRVSLLTPISYDEEQFLCVSYNYFEDDWWESAGYNARDGKVWSNKVGHSKFCLVMLAAYVLLEFYSESFIIGELDGELRSEKMTIGWLNHLFGEAYTNKRVSNLWEIYKILPEHARKQDLFSITRGTDAFRDHDGDFVYLVVAQMDEYDKQAEEINKERIPGQTNVHDWIKIMRKYLAKVKEDQSLDDEGKLKHLKELLVGPTPEVWDIARNDDYSGVCLAGRLIHRQIAVKLIADAFELDFWALLEEMEPLFPSENALYEGRFLPDGEPQPLPELTTEMFLNIEDADRLYFWRPESDVILSEETKALLVSFREEFEKILAEEGQLIAPENFFVELLGILQRLDKTYQRVYFFSDTFREFVSHNGDRRVRAAVALLLRLMERFEEEKEELAKACWPYQFRTPGRLTIKRYVALLANPELRREVLGF